MVTISNSTYAMIGDCYIDLKEFLGCSYKSIPLKHREMDEGITHVDSYNYVVDDIACDPRNGGIGDLELIAACYGVGVQQFRRNILPTLTYIQYFGNKPVTNISSVQADGMQYQVNIHNNRCQNLGVLPAGSFSGSNY